ncbi:MAG: hypothetical protein KA035_00010 [Candidatus Levybacteria bacterium]|nr:hypothetical protein [Candidatus Levybacteria bacterium]
MAEKTKKPTIKKTISKRPVKAVEVEYIPPEKQQLDYRNPNVLARQAVQGIMLPPKVIAQIADQVAKAVYDRVPKRAPAPKKKSISKDTGFILDTSAIIDGRIFDLARVGAFFGNFIVISGVLDELKNIADARDDVKKERGKRALRALDDFKKLKDVKLIHVEDGEPQKAVDERIINYARKNKGRILTCDFNLSKKARITGVTSIDLYEMANILKTTAVPGEEFFVKIVQKGKGAHQGVGYLPDGTMIVVEQGELLIDKTVKVNISRVIQTDAGRIFFGKIAM